MRRLLATLLAAAGLAGIGLVAGAAPAQAACPTAQIIPHDVMWGTQYVGTDTRVIRCDNGTPSNSSDDYFRLDWWAYTDSSDIRRTYGYTSGGNPIMDWMDENGANCNRINGYSEWRVGGVDFIDLGNQICRTPVYFTVIGTADRIATFDSPFQYSVWKA